MDLKNRHKTVYIILLVMLLLLVGAAALILLFRRGEKAELSEPAETVHSNDAKFFKDKIIAGVDGALTVLDYDGKEAARYPDIRVQWCHSLESENLIVYGNDYRQVGILQLDNDYNVTLHNKIYEGENLYIDPTIIKADSSYFVTFTEIIGAVNNSDPNGENGEYKLHLYKSEDLENWEEVAVILDNSRNTEDIDIMFEHGRFEVFYELEDYDKGCSSINVITSKDETGTAWNEPKELLPADADHEMACIEKREDGYRIWYSCDKDAPGQSYSAGRIYCADFEEDLTCRAKDEALIKRQSEYDGIGGVRLYDVRQIDGKNYYLYARNYLTDNELRIIIK